MNSREREALDRHITGNYGEDQMAGEEEFEALFESAQVMYDTIQKWRETGVAPDFGELTAHHDQLGEALKAYA